ncbi:MAG: hypothetical protein MUE85_15635 [Microscillaceae bacterium]|jgi:hypothetical protein|nr:hypothetical protein [Microscillaceae bacterium]
MIDLLRQLISPDIIVPMMVFAIPLTAIIGSFYLKLQKLKLEKGGMTSEEKQLLYKTYQENQELKKRVSDLESIVTSLDNQLEFKNFENKKLK